MNGQGNEREQLWRERLACQADSAMTVTAFCETVGVSTAAFYQWRKRLQNGQPLQHAAESLFVRVAVREPEPANILLELSQSVRVEIPENVSEGRLVSVFRAAVLATETPAC